MIGLVADHQVAAAGNAELDMDHRRDRAAAVLRALVDADTAGGEPVVELFEVGDASADLLLRPSRTFDVMEGDFERYLQHRRLHIFGAFCGSC